MFLYFYLTAGSGDSDFAKQSDSRRRAQARRFDSPAGGRLRFFKRYSAVHFERVGYVDAHHESLRKSGGQQNKRGAGSLPTRRNGDSTFNYRIAISLPGSCGTPSSENLGTRGN